jgi:hypothetical protein
MSLKGLKLMACFYYGCRGLAGARCYDSDVKAIELEFTHQQNVGILVWSGELDNVWLRRPGQI